MNKIRHLFTLLATVCCGIAITSCDGNIFNKDDNKSSVTTISFDKTELVLEVGDSYQLSVNSDSAEEIVITYLSSDSGVVSVDTSGKITALGEGSATVYGKFGELTTSCHVTVNAKEPEFVPINGFVPFAKGGLIGGPGGTYYPVTVSAVGEEAVKFSGKGGLSWPDTENNLEPDAMGGYYKEKLDIQGLNVTYKLDQPMDFAGDHWYFIALENQEQLFNSWNGSDPTKTIFFMIGYENDKILLKAHYRDVIELGESWSYLGSSQGVAGNISDQFTITFNVTDAGLETYINGELQIYDNVKSPYIPVALDFFPDNKAYVMAAAHIGNPEDQYTGDYAFTLGVSKQRTTFTNIESLSFESSAMTMKVDEEKNFNLTVAPVGAEVNFVTYKSSSPDVATIDAQGKVKALKEGKTKITAKSQGKTASCDLTVEKADVLPSTVTLNVDNVSLMVGQTTNLTATVLPADTTNKNVTWEVVESKDNVTITVDSQDNSKAIITAIKEGSCVVKASCGDKSATCTVEVAPLVIPVTSISLNKESSDVYVGETVELTATVLPADATNKTVSWRIVDSKDNVSLAVDPNDNSKCVVTGVKNGECVVSATAGEKTTTCTFVVSTRPVPATNISLNKTSAEVRVDDSFELIATISPENSTETFVSWTVLESKTNVTLAVDSNDSRKVTVTGASEGECVVQATCSTFTAQCAVSVKLGLNGLNAFKPGGLVNNTSYEPVIMSTIEYAPTDRVKFSGKGGTNWGDTQNNPSTMGGYSLEKLPLDGGNILYSVTDWVQNGDHWYYIALTSGARDQLFGNNESSAGTLFFMFSYNGGKVYLNAHYVGAGYGWTQIGTSQGVTAVGGEYNINIRKVENGYSVYMKNAEQSEYALMNFGGTSIISDTIMNTLFGEDKNAYVQAGAYVATYDGDWSFVLGVDEPIVNEESEEVELNGMKAFQPGGLVNNTSYEPVSMSTIDYAPTDRVKFSGKGGTNWGDTQNNPSTMGGYYKNALDLNGANILYSVTDWIGGGDHWYYIALTNGPKNQLFGNSSASAGTLFFMFSYNDGKVYLNAHYVGAGNDWTQIGMSQGVTAAGGEYNINLRKVDGGYSVYMKNASETSYTLMNFGGTTILSDSIMNTLFGQDQQAYLQAGAYVSSFEGLWSFVLGLDTPIKNEQ